MTPPLDPTIAALLRKIEGQPEAMLRFAKLLRDKGQGEDAHRLAHRALALARTDPRINQLGREFLSGGVPDWHFSLVRDEVRNRAYDAALRRAIRPGMRVLEIGTGSGILAMMAARAGAAEVITCEMNPIVAETARLNIARNGYADRIRVLGLHSDKLDAEHDLGGRMDLLVSEIVSNDLLAEDILPAQERAMRDLLKPGAAAIPACGVIRVALAENSLAKHAPVGNVDGFDLSAMEDWRAPVLSVKNTDGGIALRSAPDDLFAFAFDRAQYTPPEQRSLTLRATGGRANGIVQWIRLAMDGATTYENAPDTTHYSCWAMRFYPFPASVESRAGDAITIHGAHDRHQVRIWIGA